MFSQIIVLRNVWLAVARTVVICCREIHFNSIYLVRIII